MQDLLFFSHANGFPAPTYHALFQAWEQQFRVISPDRIGHDPRHPVTRDWPHLTDELLQRLDAAAGDSARIWLVGHSLGGYLSVLAAEQARSSQLGERIAGVVLLDSPLIAGLAAWLIKVGHATGLDRLLMPLEQTRQRRTHWDTVEAVHAHYAAKPSFANWDQGVLQHYANHATTATGQGRQLLFDRDIEYAIYRTLPTLRVVEAAQRLPCPLAFIGGTRSRELRAIGLGATRRRVGERLQMVEGSHLFPMERPGQTAEAVAGFIEQMRTPHP